MSMAYKIKRYVGFVSFVVFLLILSTEARADLYLYGFEVVENNSQTAVADQLSLEVSDPGTTVLIPGDTKVYNQVRFTFYNDGPLGSDYDVLNPVESSITDVYFEDGTLLGLATIENSTGVIFGQPVSPGNLTGANTLVPAFEATTAFSVDSESPIQPNGVNPGESLGLLYALKYDESSGDPFTFDDVINALELGFTNPDPEEPRDSLRIGIRVQGIGDYSDSFILTPEPGSLLLGSIGIGMVIARCRKRKTLKES